MGNGGDNAKRIDPVRHLYIIDLIRFFSACGVAVFHLTWNYAYFANVPPLGWVGVEIFFVISGYVIAGSMANTGAGDFVKKRFLRLYPAGWICTVISMVMLLSFGTAQRIVGVSGEASKGAFVYSMALFGERFVATAYWTLPVELAFYAAMTLLLVVGRPHYVTGLAKAFIAAGAIYALALLGHKTGYISAGWLDFGYGLKNALLLRHGIYFALGIIIYRMSSGISSKGEPYWAAFALFVGALEIYERAWEISGKSISEYDPSALFAICCAAWLFSNLAILNAAKWNGIIPASRTTRQICRSVGLATYPLYLLHEAVGGSVMGAFVLHGAPPVAALLLALALCLVASLVVCLYLEPRLRRFLSVRVLGRAGAGVTPPPFPTTDSR